MKLRRILASLLALTMILALTVSACADYTPKTIKLGIDNADNGTIPIEALTYNLTKLTGINVETLYFGLEKNADQNISFVESAIAADCDVVVFMPAADSVLPTVCDLCEEAGVYWGIALRYIADDEIREYCEASKYYLGYANQDNESLGYNVGCELGKAGFKQLAMIATTKGNSTVDAREKGLRRACDEYGMEIVAESRGHAQASEITSSVESFLAVYKDLDAVICCGTLAVGADEAAIQAIVDSKSEVKYVSTGASMLNLQACMATGVHYIAAVPLEQQIPYFIMSLIGINTLNGYEFEGMPAKLHYENIMIHNLDEATVVGQVTSHSKVSYYTDENLANLFAWNNSALTLDDMQKAIENLDVIVDE